MYHGKDDFSSYGVKGILSAHSENIVKYPPHWIYMSNKRCETALYDVEEAKDDFSSIFCVLFYSGWTEYD